MVKAPAHLPAMAHGTDMGGALTLMAGGAMQYRLVADRYNHLIDWLEKHPNPIDESSMGSINK